MLLRSFNLRGKQTITSLTMYSSRRPLIRTVYPAKTRPEARPCVLGNDDEIEVPNPPVYFTPITPEPAKVPETPRVQHKAQPNRGAADDDFELPEAIENEIAKGPVLALEEFDWLRNEDWEDVDSIMDDAFVATVDSVF